MGTVSQRVTNGPLTKSGVLWQKTDFRAKIRPGGLKTGRRAAERPPTRKLKLSRVTSGYGGLKTPLGRIHLTPKNGGYMGENGDFRAGGHWEKLRSSEMKRATGCLKKSGPRKIGFWQFSLAG